MDTQIIVNRPIQLLFDVLELEDDRYPSMKMYVEFCWCKSYCCEIRGKVAVWYGHGDWTVFRKKLFEIYSGRKNGIAQLADLSCDLVIYIERSDDAITFTLEYWISRFGYEPHFLYKEAIDEDVLAAIHRTFDGFLIWKGE